MFSSFFTTKLTLSQLFDAKGKRIMVTNLKAEPLTITQVKTKAKDGYTAVQVAVLKKSVKSLKNPQKSKLKSAKLTNPPLFYREIKLTSEDNMPQVGDVINLSDVLKPGDKIKASSLTKGRGFAGVIKRWGFAGGPRDHGQSDRERAPGSIGMRTDPGRVWKGKKMAGHYGNVTLTIRNLQVVSLDDSSHILTITGSVPGARNGLVTVTKTGTFKRPITLTAPAPAEAESKAKPEETEEKTA